MTTTWSLETAAPPAWCVNRIIDKRDAAFSGHKGRFVELYWPGFDWCLA